MADDEGKMEMKQPMSGYAGWFKVFMEEWRKRAGDQVECDADTEDMLLMEFYLKGMSPSEAVVEMMSEELP